MKIRVYGTLEQFEAALENRIEAQVKKKLQSVGVDTNSREAIWYMDDAVDLILQDDAHDVDYWWKETQADDRFMSEVDALPHVVDNRTIHASEFDELDSRLTKLENRIEAQVKKKLQSVGVDTNSREAIWYMDDAVDLILQDDAHDVDYWWKETKVNYMDEVDALPHVHRKG